MEENSHFKNRAFGVVDTGTSMLGIPYPIFEILKNRWK